MSGPKCIDLRRQQRMLERAQNLERCAEIKASFVRLQAELAQVLERLTELGAEAAAAEIDATEFSRRVDALLASGRDREAVRWATEQARSLRNRLAETRAKVQRRVTELQKKAREISLERVRARQDRDRAKALLQRAAGAGLKPSDLSHLRKLGGDLLGGGDLPEAPTLRLNRESIRLLEKAEATVHAARESGAAPLAALESEFRRLQGEASLGKAVSRGTTQRLADFLQPLTAPPSPSPSNSGTAGRLEEALAKIAELGGTEAVEPLLGKAEALRREEDASLACARLDDFLLACQAQVELLEKWRTWRDELGRLLDLARAGTGARVSQLRSELEGLQASKSAIDLAPWTARLDKAIAEDRDSAEHEQCRRTVVQSLKSLGYEVQEGLETALTKGGSVVFQKSPKDEYGVQITTTPSLSRLETRVVRFAEAEGAEASAQQRLRDKEREEVFCQEHARLRKDLQAAGYDVNFAMAKKPGEYPVKVLADAERTRQHRTSSKQATPKARRTG